MTEGTLDDLYFEWLYHQIAAVRNKNPQRSHWKLCKRLYTTQFTWSVRNDENRSADGVELRSEFIDQCDLEDVDPEWIELECSMLEMLIALARRAAFETDVEPVNWFAVFLDNLKLRQYTDFRWNEVVEDKVDHILDRLLNRTYEKDGAGGLFPLTRIRQDQRKVELWDQLSAYILENEFSDLVS